MQLLRNLHLRSAAYNTVRTLTVLPIYEIKTAEMDIKRWRMVHITKISGDYYGCRNNPDSSSGIYMNLLMETQCRIEADNKIKQDEVKQNEVRFNS